MSLGEIIGSGTGILIILLTCIEITPIKLNPWSWIARHIGRAMNKEITEKVENLEKKIGDLEDKIDAEHESLDEYKARQSRMRILRFGDELRNKQLHTKEHFDDVMAEIDIYEMYCKTHPDFQNGISVQTIKFIRENYGRRLVNNDFL